MAMAASPYASTEETTNACRACRLLLGPCTDELRDVFRHFVPPSAFPHVIKQNISNLPRLTAPQLNLILPRGSTYTGNYNDMDIPLLYSLLRNICSIPSHIKGWGNDPDLTDRSLSANIERIRVARNQCVHSSSPVLSNADFNTVWSTVRAAVVDIDSFLNNRNQYEREVDFLRQETMDPDRDRYYIEELRKQAEEDAETRKIVQVLKRKIDESDMDRIENQNKMLKIVDEKSNAVIPQNVKAIQEIDISQWKEVDNVFHESHNFRAMLNKVKGQSYVTFVGVPGSGKTATARHVALMLQQEGYEIVPIRDIRKIEDYCDPKNPQVFVIDDVVGVFGLQETKLNLLSDYQDRIMKPTMPLSKTLMTCREAIYRKTIEISSFFTDKNNILLLHSEDNALNNTDKRSMLKMYSIDVNLLSSASLSIVSKMFPYLCKMYSTDKKIQLYGSVFFENPVPCILKELEEMKKQNKIHYVSLVLCTMNENKVPKTLHKENETVMHKFNKIKNYVLQKCKVNSQTDDFEFIEALSEMEGTYTNLRASEYSLFHDSMIEIVAYHCGLQFPEMILQFMNSNYIANFVKLHKGQSENEQAYESVGSSCESKREEEKDSCFDKIKDHLESFDLSIRLREDLYSMFAERLYRDVENLDVYDVFMNDTLKQPEISQAFIKVLISKSYAELKSLFLSIQKNISKIVRKGEYVREKSEKKRSREWDRQKVLVNEICVPKPTYCVRVISWMIYHGHSHILRHILEQTELHNETHSEFFKNRLDKDLKYRKEKRKISPYYPEQHRLLILSCYSGDLETVRTLLKYGSKNLINESLENLGDSCMWYDTPLTAACQDGYMNIVKELIAAGADVNLKDTYDFPLTAACEGGHTSVVKELLKSGALVNAQGYDTPLTAASAGGQMSIVKDLLKAGADVNLEGKFNTPLTSACENGHLDVVKELLNAGAYVNLQDKYHTPLTAACENGHINVIDELLMAGSNINQQDVYNTPLIAVCKGGHVSLVKGLLEAGADVNLQGMFNTPLTAACESGHISVVNKLIEAGADLNLQGEYNTPLISACEIGQIRVAKKLLEKGAAINLQGGYNTPLIAACEGGYLSVVKDLLEAGADVNLPGEFNTPLIAACKCGHLSILKELVNVGAYVNLQGKFNTPLTGACEDGQLSVVKELLKAGADVNLQGEFHTPLTAACANGHMIVANELLKAGANSNIENRVGQTPLYVTLLNSTEALLPTVSMLKKYGADASIINEEGLSPLDIALFRNSAVVIKGLLQNESGNQKDKLKIHLFDCLVNIRHSDVGIDYRGDVVVTQSRVWRMKESGDLYSSITDCKCEVLRQMLLVGLDANQWIQLQRRYQCDVKPLLFVLIDAKNVEEREKK